MIKKHTKKNADDDVEVEEFQNNKMEKFKAITAYKGNIYVHIYSMYELRIKKKINYQIKRRKEKKVNELKWKLKD